MTTTNPGPNAVNLEGNPLILVVDDEELIREVASIMIEDHGGRPVALPDGPSAISYMEENKDNVKAILLDFSMPGMNGYEAYLQIKQIAPEIKVAFFSGLTVVPEVEDLVRKGENELKSLSTMLLSKESMDIILSTKFSKTFCTILRT